MIEKMKRCRHPGHPINRLVQSQRQGLGELARQSGDMLQGRLGAKQEIFVGFAICSVDS